MFELRTLKRDIDICLQGLGSMANGVKYYIFFRFLVLYINIGSFMYLCVSLVAQVAKLPHHRCYEINGGG